VSLFERYGEGGKNQKLKNWASENYPRCDTISTWQTIL